MRTLQAASAIFAGKSYKDSFAAIADGVTDPVMGMVSMDHAQICPQHPGYLSDRIVDSLLQAYPDTRFRLHASPKMGPDQPVIDAANAPEQLPTVRSLARLSKLLHAEAYSLHAGDRETSSLETALDNCRRLQDIFECQVAIEGLYPLSPRRPDPYLLSDWSEHRQLLSAGVPFALDLSHIAIVVTKYGREDTLLAELLAHPDCIEIHVSANDGRRDIHQPLDPQSPPWWLPILASTPNIWAPIFYEGWMKTPKDRPA